MAFQKLGSRAVGAVVLVAGVLAMAGCGGSDDAKPATQVAARVNSDEISVHQINNVLARTPNLKPEQVDMASSRVLERLIDQELLVQRAIDKKLDRNPQVMQAIEAARREILSRSYMEQFATTAEAPAPEAIKAFYDEHPALFAQRRIYTLQELNISVSPEQAGALRDAVSAAGNLNEVVAWLREHNLPFQVGGGVRAAEQLPLETLPRFAGMKDGQIGLVTTPKGVLVIYLAASREQPLDLAAATPFIERFLLNRTKADMARNELKRLRDVAQIEYMGKFTAPEAGASADAGDTPALLDNAAAPVSEAPAMAVPTAASTDALSAQALEKGVSGLK
ncbi:EpsD family peptidyl-prolyl cis-trans isomerase [Denitromonas iodatirespirans]|uniref:EpsD family peptidyl-prolyl cis-trans isomerase n=1 Tax=Denitromonas iodatirespirans TaxID=2795389 RepID=A0A944H9T1_DENI1|nr:EpsD family peptidyl-prolyl cis-trans isomerase [Denitromonas iodatirespirans]MBT0962770.1 EpsD family peptidyl-prolyl cis-trans isomerase [Denitromonas iodatirespirans]